MPNLQCNVCNLAEQRAVAAKTEVEWVADSKRDPENSVCITLHIRLVNPIFTWATPFFPGVRIVLTETLVMPIVNFDKLYAKEQPRLPNYIVQNGKIRVKSRSPA